MELLVGELLLEQLGPGVGAELALEGERRWGAWGLGGDGGRASSSAPIE